MKLIWLDVETTGLDPDKDELLELAFAEADLARPFVIGPVRNHVFRIMPRTMETLNPFAREAHGKSGLLEACAGSTTTVHEVEEQLLTIVPEVADRDEKPTLAGRGAHFDLGFLRVHMPRLAARLSYRVYDVSAVGLFCESLGMPRLKKAEAHRAHDDVMESIDHARRCAAWLAEPIEHAMAALAIALPNLKP